MKKKTNGTQLELFKRDPMESLFPYWRERLRHWLEDVWMYRHNHNTTGWSMACQGLLFPEMLFRHGQITKTEFRRWWRLQRRVRRWDKTKGGAV